MGYYYSDSSKALKNDRKYSQRKKFLFLSPKHQSGDTALHYQSYFMCTYYYFIDAILFYSLHKCTFDIMYFFIKTLLKWNDRLIYIKYIDPNLYNTYPLFSNQLAGWVSFNADLIIVPQDISRVFQGLLRSDPRTIKDKASFTRLWIHEVSRVISDKLVDSNDREQFLGIVNYQLAKYFDTTYQLIVPFPPLVFCECQQINVTYHEVHNIHAFCMSLMKSPKFENQIANFIVFVSKKFLNRFSRKLMISL